MLPMGTIMAACMAIGVVALALSLAGPLARGRAPGRAAGTPADGVHPLLAAAGGLVLLAGLWNALWHAPRHLGQFWGQAALGSGLVMLLVAAYLLVPARLPPWLRSLRPLALLALAAFATLYGVTIYRL